MGGRYVHLLLLEESCLCLRASSVWSSLIWIGGTLYLLRDIATVATCTRTIESIAPAHQERRAKLASDMGPPWSFFLSFPHLPYFPHFPHFCVFPISPSFSFTHFLLSLFSSSPLLFSFFFHLPSSSEFGDVVCAQESLKSQVTAAAAEELRLQQDEFKLQQSTSEAFAKDFLVQVFDCSIYNLQGPT